jgi:hypothetical protein
MPSTLSWIDYDSEAQQRAQRILMLFKERDTRDELGFGPVRDAISDTLFPGTSTLHTRLRYMLFVPWGYLQLEKRRITSNKICVYSRQDQLKLAALLKNNASVELGVIGGDVGDKLKTLPSAIYWAALGRWGLRVYPGTEGQYQGAVDDIYRRRKNAKVSANAAFEHGDDVGGLWEVGAHSFHPGFPEIPTNFPDNETFNLTKAEARYLQERIRQSVGNSLLADLLNDPVEVKAGAPWQHPNLAKFRPEHKELLWHARHFSTIAYSAAVLYNQLLAKKRGDEELLAQHREAGRSWLEEVDREIGEVEHWASDLSAFWRSVENRGHVIEPRTVIFIEQWINMLLQYRESIFDQPAAKALIRNREIEKKRRNSRFTNSRVLDQWGGRSGMTRMVYRWPIAQSYIADMAEAVGTGQ